MDVRWTSDRKVDVSSERSGDDVPPSSEPIHFPPNATSFVVNGRTVGVAKLRQASISPIEAREAFHAISAAGRVRDARRGPDSVFAKYRIG
jgi:hypothetical protein